MYHSGVSGRLGTTTGALDLALAVSVSRRFRPLLKKRLLGERDVPASQPAGLPAGRPASCSYSTRIQYSQPASQPATVLIRVRVPVARQPAARLRRV